MEDIVKTIGKRIKELREENGFSKNHLAVLSDIHPAWISRLEIGHRKTGKLITPSIITLQKIAKGLGVSIEVLLKDSTAKKMPGLQDDSILREIKLLLKNQTPANKQLLLLLARKVLKY
jgi:transcriptional regulator with XRE-family HTH domain